MLKIGTIAIDRGILLAPMEEVTDPPFRIVCRQLGADIVYTEFISSEGLIREAAKSMKKLTVFDAERPVAIQIFGGDETIMAEAARMAEQSRPDFIDINYGCWVKNVVARNAGAAMLRDLPAMERLTRAVVESVKLPVTVKTRLGWDSQSINIVEAARRLEQTGIHALAVHCRVRSQGHDGNADWSWIPKIKAAVRMPVILNGDVQTPRDAARAFAETGCDAVMIGRAAIRNPWIFRETKRYLRTGELPPPMTLDRSVETCLRHLRLSLQYKFPERRAVVEFRKYYAGYLRGVPHIARARAELMRMESFSQVEERLLRLRAELQEPAREAAAA